MHALGGLNCSRQWTYSRLTGHLSGFVDNQTWANDMLRDMYGLEKQIDLSFFAGREIIQVAIGVYQVQFAFDEDVTISAESEFRYFDGKAEWIWRPEPGSASIAARAVALLGATITGF
jgi:hypothetical protein